MHRRDDGSIDFDRDWHSYKSGFGFLFREFWLGNEKISFLTNQKRYQLVIDLTISNGSMIRLSYDDFRIGDEFSEFKLANLGQYLGNTGKLYLLAISLFFYYSSLFFSYV